MSTLGNRALETSATQSTGTYDLDGPVTGFQSLVAALTAISGASPWAGVRYVVTDDQDWEVGTGTLTDSTPDTLTRDVIEDSSQGGPGSPVNWGAGGPRNVFLAPSAGQLASLTDPTRANGIIEQTAADTYAAIAIPIPVAKGGTAGITAAAARTALDLIAKSQTARGDIMAADASFDLVRIALGTSGFILRSDGSDPVWVDPKLQSAAFPKNWRYALRMEIEEAGDPLHDINVPAGWEIRDKDDSVNMISTVERAKQIDATWAAGDNFGGMDESLDPIAGTGAKTYYVHALTEANGTGTPEIGIDDQQDGSGILADSVVVAASLTKAQLIGLIRVDASDNIESIAYKLGDGRWRWISKSFAGTASATVTVANPFTGLPRDLQFLGALNTTADGYVSGDVVVDGMGHDFATGASYGMNVYYDATVIGFVWDANIAWTHKTSNIVQIVLPSDIDWTLTAYFDADAI